ncbi:MAG: hypothetical protein K0V04_11700 [Deltaproteobacteria bacterium]|nr:hypothetical protein [Deltaproteobacteria bacterium]
MTPELRSELEHLLRRSQKLQAIALYRRETGAGLAEAKRAVDGLHVEPVLPTPESIWMTTARRGFFSIPPGLELPTGSARLIDAHGHDKWVDPACLGLHMIPRHVAQAVLGDDAVLPGRSAAARAHRARLVPALLPLQWAERLFEAAQSVMREQERIDAREYLDVGEALLAVEMIVDWLTEDDRASVTLQAVMSDALVACGGEPLDPPPAVG